MHGNNWVSLQDSNLPGQFEKAPGGCEITIQTVNGQNFVYPKLRELLPGNGQL